MRKLMLLFVTIGIGVMSVRAQVATPTRRLYSAKTLEELKAIMRAALDNDYAYRQTAYLSNNIGPRLSGSPQAERAVEYVAAEMRKLGLDVRLQKPSVPHCVRGEEKAELVDRKSTRLNSVTL